MALTWAQVVQYAKRHGIDEKQLRKGLAAKGVSKATVTNWKRERPVPPAQYALIASVIGGSVDELMGRSTESGVMLVAPRDPAATLLAAEITKLDPQLREFLAIVVECLVARQKRGERRTTRRVPPELHDA